MNQISTSVKSLKGYITWFSNGQYIPTGIEFAPFNELNTESTSALNQLSIINSGIQAFKNKWNQFIQNPSNNMASVFEQDLNELKLQTELLISMATRIESNSIKLSSSIGFQIDNLDVKIQNYKIEYEKAQKEYDTAMQEYGYLMIPFRSTSIDDNIQKERIRKIEKMKIAKDKAQSSLNTANEVLEKTINAQNTLNECKSIVNELNDLMRGLTNLQNVMESASLACKEAALVEHYAANEADEISSFIKLATAPIKILLSVGDDLNTSFQ